MTGEGEERLLYVLVPQTRLANKNSEGEKEEVVRDTGAAGSKASQLSQRLWQCGLESGGMGCQS